MPTSPLPAKAQAMLAKPNPAVITSLRADGQPVSVATWYLFEGGRLLVNMDAARKRLEYLRADPRVSLTALDNDSWYSHVSMTGRVVDLHDDVDKEDIDRISTHYTGHAYSDRVRPRVSAWIEIDSWHGWGDLR